MTCPDDGSGTALLLAARASSSRLEWITAAGEGELQAHKPQRAKLVPLQVRPRPGDGAEIKTRFLLPALYCTSNALQRTPAVWCQSSAVPWRGPLSGPPFQPTSKYYLFLADTPITTSPLNGKCATADKSSRVYQIHALSFLASPNHGVGG